LAGGFSGIRPAAFVFLRELASNQTKAWFDVHKPMYERELRQPLGLLVDTLAGEFDRTGIPLTGDAKRSLFRINRDVRFSKDKSPYKTNAGAIWFRPGSGKDGSSILYLHVADEGCFMAAAFYLPDKDVLESIREGIRVRPEQFLAMKADLEAAGLDLDLTGGLVRMPRGFEDLAETPIAPFLKLRSFMVRRDLTKAQLEDPGALIATLAAFTSDALPLLRFGWRAVDEVSHQRL
jgi:uncharacterized protein (TIGR02453 family)